MHLYLILQALRMIQEFGCREASQLKRIGVVQMEMVDLPVEGKYTS